jgi:hypothetical protein
MGSARISGISRVVAVTALASVLSLGAGVGSARALTMLEPQDAPFDGSRPTAVKDIGKVVGPTTVYGRLATQGEIDVYAFTAAKDGDLPVSLATPAWPGLADFRIAALVVPRAMVKDRAASSLPMLISSSIEVIDPNLTERERFRDGLSATTYYVGGASQVPVNAGDALAVIVFNTSARQGAYALTIGGREGDAMSPLSAPRTAARLKFGAYGGSGPEIGVVLGCLAQVLVVVAAVMALVWWLRRRAATPADSDGTSTG